MFFSVLIALLIHKSKHVWTAVRTCQTNSCHLVDRTSLRTENRFYWCQAYSIPDYDNFPLSGLKVLTGDLKKWLRKKYLKIFLGQSPMWCGKCKRKEGRETTMYCVNITLREHALTYSIK